MMVQLDEKCRITANENNLVNIALPDGTVLNAVEPRRLFPVSKPNEYLTFLDADEREVARLKNADVLEQPSREVLEAALKIFYFVPEIKSVEKFEMQNRGIRFEVTTDSGKTEFLVGNPTASIRNQADGSIRFRDTNDNRYTVPNPDRLDRHSKAQLFVYLEK